jgi:hypothetical protein
VLSVLSVWAEWAECVERAECVSQGGGMEGRWTGSEKGGHLRERTKRAQPDVEATGGGANYT